MNTEKDNKPASHLFPQFQATVRPENEDGEDHRGLIDLLDHIILWGSH